ncbi:SHOCT domain-containing protein [Streptomyces tropicalis]|uniref:SHOCT domain-containing protein n=1 Tax=Streptomyces tropicalis TaxID=3034234 RepID=A0ABT6A3U9_9ACTN|nr:SHOCT domain-containing protein [Streptomyces tropicalis]MDF3299307.1 SHOCT domain-containing protein [Streptomyces tropicalis]
MHTHAYGNGGPGPWILLVPLVWAAVVLGVVTVLRRTGRRGGPGGPWRGPFDGLRGGADGHPAPDSPLAVLGRRFASGEIEEDEYWRRLSVLEEQFGRAGGRGGPA